LTTSVSHLANTGPQRRQAATEAANVLVSAQTREHVAQVDPAGAGPSAAVVLEEVEGLIDEPAGGALAALAIRTSRAARVALQAALAMTRRQPCP
jgi:hypothetical protein